MQGHVEGFVPEDRYLAAARDSFTGGMSVFVGPGDRRDARSLPAVASRTRCVQKMAWHGPKGEENP
jgi:hypothetical protein